MTSPQGRTGQDTGHGGRRGRQQQVRLVGQSRGDQYRARAAVVHPTGKGEGGSGRGVQAQDARSEPTHGEGQGADGRCHHRSRDQQQSSSAARQASATARPRRRRSQSVTLSARIEEWGLGGMIMAVMFHARPGSGG